MRGLTKGKAIAMAIGMILAIGITIKANQYEKKIETIRLTAVGDIMMHKEQIEAGYNQSTGSYNYDYMFSAVKPYIESADIAVGNLETTLAGKDKGYTGYPMFNAPEQLAFALKNTGFDVLTLANNHSLDRRFYGVEHTIKVVEQAGLSHTGTARTKAEQDKVLIKDVKGIKIAFMAYTYGTNGVAMDKGKEYSVNLLNKDKMKRDIGEAKKLGADVICVSLHFGEEYKQVPSASQKEWVKFLTDQGVDIVLGSHPHVLQPMGFEGDNFVIYSLGNFVSAQRTQPRDSSILLNITMTKNFETGETTIDSADYIPIWTDLSRVNGKHHFRVLPVETAINNYDNKNDAYLTSRDYQKLKQSLKGTTSMYKRPEIQNKFFDILGQKVALQTIEIDGHQLVEARALMNQLNCGLVWEEASSQIRIGGGEELLLTLGGSYATRGQEVMKLSKAPQRVKGRVFVPMRSVVEAMGYTISYDTATQSVAIHLEVAAKAPESTVEWSDR